MNEGTFGREFGSHRLEQLETGVEMEYCERTLESSFEEEDNIDLLFGCMELPSCDDSIGEYAPYGIADQLYYLDLIREIPVSDDSLPSCCGTSVMDIEYLLEMQEISFELLHDASLSDITEALAQDYRVLCVIRMPKTVERGVPLSPYEAGCLAEIRGIDLRDPDSAKVSLYSLSGIPRSWHYSLEEFMKARHPFNNRCYVIYQESNYEH